MKELQEMVDSIANDISTGAYDFDTENEYYDEPCAADYLRDALDIEYTINSKKEYLGARVLVAFGGPNIWIDTRYGIVEGLWWGDKATAHFEDSLGLNDYLEEIYGCL